MSYQSYKRGLVRISRRMKLAQYKQLSITSGILALVYGYNGFREKEVDALKNIFYFLSGNLVLLSATTAFKYFQYEKILTPQEKQDEGYSLMLFPYPGISWNF